VSFSNLIIGKLGPKGDGIHEGERGRVFVERTAPGDRIQAKILKNPEGVVRGEVVKILQPSVYRQKPPCVHYDRCGNCTLQHLTPEFYRHWKVETVKEAFLKQGLRPKEWLKPVFLGEKNRRRVTFSAYKFRSKIIFGYYKRRSQELIEINSCLIADPKILRVKDLLKPFLHSLLMDGKTIDVFLQVVSGAVDMVLTGPLGRRGEPDTFIKNSLSDLMKLAEVDRISWRQDEKSKIQVLFSKRPIRAVFGEINVDLPPAAFLQPTFEGEMALVEAVVRALPTQGDFADLFSGCGTFAGRLLMRGLVSAYESSIPAVNALSRAASSKLKVFKRDLFTNPLTRKELNAFNAIVFDPPRTGCLEQVIEMAQTKIPTLIGVSCNPATFARDARILCDGGYRLKSLQVVDQFLWSHHVEVVGVFTK